MSVMDDESDHELVINMTLTSLFREPKSNIDYLISMTFKKGQSPKFVATYNSNKGEERNISEDSLDELLAIISEN